MIRRRFLAAVPSSLAACVAFADSAARAGGGNSRFPTTVDARIGGKSPRMTLTGSAIRKKYGLSVYAVGSYVDEGVKIRDASTLARADVAKQLHLIFERDVDGRTMASAFRASIGASDPAPAFEAELAGLERYFLAHDVEAGDHIWLTHVPGYGLGVNVNSLPGLAIPGVKFAQAAWGTYFGPNHLGVALKEGLTSRLR